MSVLSGVSRSAVCHEPFPHVVIRDAVPDELCDDLIHHFPAVTEITRSEQFGQNVRYSLPASDVICSDHIAPVWRDFVAQHVGDEFLTELIGILGDDILDEYPEFESRFGPLGSLRAGIRGASESASIQCDAQICVNTPSGGNTRVRGAHVDLPNKLFAGLFYLRNPQDKSSGGNLEIIRPRSGRRLRFDGHSCSYHDVDVVTEVPYEKNVLVLFLNTARSLHGVTERSRTDVPRMFMNLVGEVGQPLFRLPQRSAFARRFRRHVQMT